MIININAAMIPDISGIPAPIGSKSDRWRRAGSVERRRRRRLSKDFIYLKSSSSNSSNIKQKSMMEEEEGLVRILSISRSECSV